MVGPRLSGPLLGLVLGAAVSALGHGFEPPEIETLSESDPLYRQLQEDISSFYRRDSAGPDRGETDPVLPVPVPSIYSYVVKEGEDFLRVQARLTLPQSTLITLNGLESMAVPPGTRLLVPTMPGLYLSTAPRTEIERFLWDTRRRETEDGLRIALELDGVPTEFVVLPGEDFSGDERLLFLGLRFRPPVAGGRLSSLYGPRTDPFTGEQAFHRGIDISAPVGTPVVAARAGVVVDTGYDRVYGLYLVLSHDGGYQTYYGHLDAVEVELRDEVASGMLIGTVGDSGLSTGPHLHFEIRSRGRHQDPLRLLPSLQRRQ